MVEAVVPKPRDRSQHPLGEQVNVEAMLTGLDVTLLFAFGQQVEQDSLEPRLLQKLRYVAITRAVPAAPAPMGKHDTAETRFTGDVRPDDVVATYRDDCFGGHVLDGTGGLPLSANTGTPSAAPAVRIIARPSPTSAEDPVNVHRD